MVPLAAVLFRIKPRIEEETTLQELILAMKYNVQLVKETADTLENYSDAGADALLLEGSKSPSFLNFALDEL